MKPTLIDRITDRITRWMGSTSSIVLHTFIFTLAFASHWIFGWSWDFILLVLTTVVSLEAIYLAIFIQRAVNQQAVRLHDVEETLDEVEDSIDEVEKSLDEVEDSIDEVERSIDEVEKSIDEADDDIQDIAEDTAKQLEQPLDEVVAEMKKILAEMQKLTKEKK